ncbi:MAG: hypothetical protein JWL90_3360 [Chthoniobacteraceae bacterium]|nr:hypothetical protein [Chthoniobacteraceae bacterium]
MTEFWEVTRERGIATVSVWALDAKFALRDLSLKNHQMQVAQLDELAGARADQQVLLSAARSARDLAFDQLKELIVRVPGVIEGMLEPESDLHSHLRLIYNVSSSFTEESALRRGRLTLGLWSKFNEQMPQGSSPLVLRQNGSAGFDVAGFEVLLLKTCVQAQQKLANAERDLSIVKSELALLESKVDQNNKRWYKAWIKNHLAGTKEGDAARSQIPTEQGTPIPAAQEIAALYPQPDQRIWVEYAPEGGHHATTLELQWRLAGEADFLHFIPLQLPSQFIGPFSAGTTVLIRTRAANSSGVMFGTEKSVMVIAAVRDQGTAISESSA